MPFPYSSLNEQYVVLAMVSIFQLCQVHKLRTDHNKLHSKLCNVMLVTTKVHMILRSGVVLTQMRDKREVVYHVTL